MTWPKTRSGTSALLLRASAQRICSRTAVRSFCRAAVAAMCSKAAIICLTIKQLEMITLSRNPCKGKSCRKHLAACAQAAGKAWPTTAELQHQANSPVRLPRAAMKAGSVSMEEECKELDCYPTALTPMVEVIDDMPLQDHCGEMPGCGGLDCKPTVRRSAGMRHASCCAHDCTLDRSQSSMQVMPVGSASIVHGCSIGLSNRHPAAGSGAVHNCEVVAPIQRHAREGKHPSSSMGVVSEDVTSPAVTGFNVLASSGNIELLIHLAGYPVPAKDMQLFIDDEQDLHLLLNGHRTPLMSYSLPHKACPTHILAEFNRQNKILTVKVSACTANGDRSAQS